MEVQFLSGGLKSVVASTKMKTIVIDILLVRLKVFQPGQR